MKDQLHVVCFSLAINLGASKTKPPGEWPIMKYSFGYIILLATWDQAFQLEPEVWVEGVGGSQENTFLVQLFLVRIEQNN